MFSKKEIIKKIHKKIKTTKITYKVLGDKTGISPSRLERCLSSWSDQDLTLSDTEKIFKALNISYDSDLTSKINFLPENVKIPLYQLIDGIENNLN